MGSDRPEILSPVQKPHAWQLSRPTWSNPCALWIRRSLLHATHIIHRPEFQSDLALEEPQRHRPIMPRIIRGGIVIALQPYMPSRNKELLVTCWSIAHPDPIACDSKDPFADASIRILRRGGHYDLATRPAKKPMRQSLEEKDVSRGAKDRHHRSTHSSRKIYAVLLDAVQHAH